MFLLIIDLCILLMVPASPDSYQDACIDCHNDKVEHEVKHEAVGNGCDICHESTGEVHPQEDRKGFKLVDQTPDLCYYCHPIVQGEVLLHSAIETGGCLICHQPHGGELRGLLTERYPEDEYVHASTENFALCFMCHDADLMDAEQTDWATNFRNGDRNLHHVHIHGAKGRNCKLCHNLHASKQKFLIEETIPFGNWEMQMNFEMQEDGGTCLPGCHGKENYARQN